MNRAIAPQPPVLDKFKGYRPDLIQVTPEYRAHGVYLIPQGSQRNVDVVVTKIAYALEHLQRWYRWQLGNGKTFNLTPNIVQVVNTPHPADWYSTHDAGGEQRGWYWANALQDLWDLCGGGFYQQYDDWLVYLDAEPGPGQYAGGTSGGYTSGVCVLHARDLNALLGQDPEWTFCRELGGLGHEGGHSFGLPHPPAGPDWERAIMGVGYNIYSGCILTAADKLWLNANPHFQVRLPRMRGNLTLCSFTDDLTRPVPHPRPHPTPHPRP